MLVQWPSPGVCCFTTPYADTPAPDSCGCCALHRLNIGGPPFAIRSDFPGRFSLVTHSLGVQHNMNRQQTHSLPTPDPNVTRGYCTGGTQLVHFPPLPGTRKGNP